MIEVDTIDLTGDDDQGIYVGRTTTSVRPTSRFKSEEPVEVSHNTPVPLPPRCKKRTSSEFLADNFDSTPPSDATPPLKPPGTDGAWNASSVSRSPQRQRRINRNNTPLEALDSYAQPVLEPTDRWQNCPLAPPNPASSYSSGGGSAQKKRRNNESRAQSVAEDEDEDLEAQVSSGTHLIYHFGN